MIAHNTQRHHHTPQKRRGEVNWTCYGPKRNDESKHTSTNSTFHPKVSLHLSINPHRFLNQSVDEPLRSPLATTCRTRTRTTTTWRRTKNEGGRGREGKKVQGQEGSAKGTCARKTAGRGGQGDQGQGIGIEEREANVLRQWMCLPRRKGCTPEQIHKHSQREREWESEREPLPSSRTQQKQLGGLIDCLWGESLLLSGIIHTYTCILAISWQTSHLGPFSLFPASHSPLPSLPSPGQGRPGLLASVISYHICLVLRSRVCIPFCRAPILVFFL